VSHLTWNAPRLHAASTTVAASEQLRNELVTMQTVAASGFELRGTLYYDDVCIRHQYIECSENM
jgi:hypothetical protein